MNTPAKHPTTGLRADITVPEVDLDSDAVYFHGERLTEARAEQLAAEVLARVPGRPSLTGVGRRSPTLSVRLAQATKAALEDVAVREGRRQSDVVRDAIEAYLAAHS